MFNEHIFTFIFLSFKILDLQDNLVNPEATQTATHPTLTLALTI